MKTIKKRKCPTCGIFFLPKSDKNIFHNRRCFKKNYYYRKKTEKLSNIKFPVFLCPNCTKKIELSFDPVKEHHKWEQFSCPFCSILMISVWEELVTQDVSIL